MIKTLEKNIQNEKLIFTNQKAVFWESQKIMIISDLHVGKSAHFRKSGIAVTSQILLDDLEVLENLISFFGAESLLIVGDLFHAGHNSDLEIFCDWRNRFPDLKITLIKGNHDRIPKKFYEDYCIGIVEDTLEIGPFTFVHEPQHMENRFTVSGHIHPGVVFQGKARQAVRLPCFAVSEKQLILPAFSKFTGLDTKTLNQNFKKIAFTKGIIFDY
ncbi:ligase-associated DNA damage response endonuclease PdeM [Kaistella sp. BT6-1-3]|uniref:Ligase-associated DNA damage response endonuclease PdeM n=1 Tax=Kaistella yananensis TaxID=2989820 RepID=A0ABT3JJH1_9FLAO|nr:ligase-associated DNA damage response endonuclease PdeM [Kaistella yananensis]MCW4450927.1 ligase-associated DNA damage response endonuclease PdeM [Kaistella yananensis]